MEPVRSHDIGLIMHMCAITANSILGAHQTLVRRAGVRPNSTAAVVSTAVLSKIRVVDDLATECDRGAYIRNPTSSNDSLSHNYPYMFLTPFREMTKVGN